MFMTLKKETWIPELPRERHLKIYRMTGTARYAGLQKKISRLWMINILRLLNHQDILFKISIRRSQNL